MVRAPVGRQFVLALLHLLEKGFCIGVALVQMQGGIEVAVDASAFAKRYVDVDTGHGQFVLQRGE